MEISPFLLYFFVLFVYPHSKRLTFFSICVIVYLLKKQQFNLLIHLHDPLDATNLRIKRIFFAKQKGRYALNAYLPLIKPT